MIKITAKPEDMKTTRILRWSETVRTNQPEAAERVVALLEQSNQYWLAIICPTSFALYGTYFQDDRLNTEAQFERYLAKHGYREPELPGAMILPMPNLFLGYDR